MARKKATKKPVRRRTTAKKPAGSFGKIGWVAAGALAIGWVASDGRALSYVGSLVPRTEKLFASAPPAAPVRQTGHRSSADHRSERAPAIADRTRMSAPPHPTRPPLPIPTRTAAMAPSPAPHLAPMRMPREPQAAIEPRRPAAPLRPSTRPQVLAPMPARPVTTPPATPSASAGGMRHATRLLVMRDIPDEAGRNLGSVVSGMRVEVLKAQGRWRYVRADAGEGWVDGSFLAGEAAASTAPLPPSVPFASPSRLANAAPVPPLAVGTR